MILICLKCLEAVFLDVHWRVHFKNCIEDCLEASENNFLQKRFVFAFARGLSHYHTRTTF